MWVSGDREGGDVVKESVNWDDNCQELRRLDFLLLQHIDLLKTFHCRGHFR